ncbi:hypothetical protein GCM10023331_25470 [Algivirga pacifica]|uniref:Bacterial surface antigen (D15) domain-containing protein n=2 Tax=Algivirga pacifica TaxID=1162670 RepID=A0ABP9DHY3_9BACT
MDLTTIEGERFNVSIYPLLDYNERAGFSFGLIAAIVFQETGAQQGSNKYYRPTTLLPSASYSTKNQLLLDADFVMFANSGWMFLARTIYYRFPDTYFGIGGPQEEVSLYTRNQFSMAGGALKPLSDVIYAGAYYDFTTLRNQDIEGESLDETVLGFEGGTVLGLGVETRWDTRDNVLYPEEGRLWRLSARHYFGDFSYNALTLDIRNFWQFKNPENVFGVQLLWEISGENTPYFKLPVLGGKDRLRSIGNPNQYIDRQVWLLQGEYRRHLWQRIGMAVFLGAGNVATHREFPFQEIQWVAGTGLRLRLLPKDPLNFRLDVGWGAAGKHALFFTIGEAF